MRERELLEILRIYRSVDGRPSAVQLELLSQFRGWGAYWRIFDPKHRYHEQLRELLTEEEYGLANSGILTSYFTDSAVAGRLWEILQGLGVMADRDLRILEPSCGIGNLMNQPISGKFYGVELDPISARIAMWLHPDSVIYQGDYRSLYFPFSYFDCAIGNVPFGDFQVNGLSIHNYFLQKTMDLVRPHGVAVLITSCYTLDSKDSSFRADLFSRNRLVSAYRLPTSVFEASSQASVSVDILVLQSLPEFQSPAVELLEVGEVLGQSVSRYFLNHPDHVLGDFAVRNQQLVVEGSRFMALVRLSELSCQLPLVYDVGTKHTRREANLPPPDFPQSLPHSFVLYQNQLLWYDGHEISPVVCADGVRDQICRQIELHEQQQNLLKAHSPMTEALCRETLVGLCDDFVNQYGPIDRADNPFRQDVRWQLVERLADKDFLNTYSRFPQQPRTYPDPKSALMACVDKFGKVDMQWIADHW